MTNGLILLHHAEAEKKHSYDIVIGPMADDQIYNYVFDFLEGNISRGQFGHWQNLNIRQTKFAFVQKTPCYA